ncbi:phospholipid phosphatase 2-like [Thrips palmi]|uniref:Phospholipid phosphatase 2-like n=1 Tax=Thrips palmi TaxID=161013 RepID=A0A6P8ZGU5_THRPL|nr:phospholipid phosphatase 2-like [Thrips palmi]
MRRELGPSSTMPTVQRSSWRDTVLQPHPAPLHEHVSVPVAAPGATTPLPPRRRSAGLVMAHLLDLVGLLLLAAVAAELRFGELYLIRPQLQGLGGLCLDTAYRTPRRNPTIELPNYAIYLLVILAPVVLLSLLEVVLAFTVRKDRTKSAWTPAFFKRLAKLTLVFLLGLCLTSAAADLLRLLVSRPRPFFLSDDAYGFGYARYCNAGTFEDRDIGKSERYARLSFPSHRCTMLAFSGVLVAVHAERVLRRVRAGGMYALRTAVVFVCAVPALLVASQVYDSRYNHWSDIVVGLLLGALTGTYVVRVLSRDLAKEMQKASAPAPTAGSRAVSSSSLPEAVNRANSLYAGKDTRAYRRPDDAYF